MTEAWKNNNEIENASEKKKNCTGMKNFKNVVQNTVHSNKRWFSAFHETRRIIQTVHSTLIRISRLFSTTLIIETLALK